MVDRRKPFECYVSLVKRNPTERSSVRIMAVPVFLAVAAAGWRSRSKPDPGGDPGGAQRRRARRAKAREAVVSSWVWSDQVGSWDALLARAGAAVEPLRSSCATERATGASPGIAPIRRRSA
jgi:hypothetical protein